MASAEGHGRLSGDRPDFKEFLMSAPEALAELGEVRGEESTKPEGIFSRDPEVVSGELVFAGTRVPAQALVDYLKAGNALEVFLDDFPTVGRGQAIGFLERALETALRQAGAGSPLARVGSPENKRTTGDFPSPEERVRARALELFGGDQRAADGWLSSPLPVLGGATPLGMARTEAGARRVESMIGGLGQGVFF